MGIIKTLNSITARMLAILILTFLFIVATVYWVIEQKGKPEIVALSTQALVETGNEVVNAITTNINHVDGLAQATSNLSVALPKDADIYRASLGTLMTRVEGNIGGGGVWFEPNQFAEEQERQSFVWQRDSNGEMQPVERYNDPNITPQPYYRDWWYVPVTYAQHNRCVWSRAYINKTSHQSVMTCAKPMYNPQNQGFDGVVSFDILLSNFADITESWQQRIDGYVFMVDLDNRFLSFPDNDLVTQSTANNPQGEMMTVSEFAEINPSFAPIANRLDSVNSDLINKAESLNQGRYRLSAGSILSNTNLNRIGDQESKLLAALMLVNEDESLIAESHLTDTVAVSDDFMLNEDATAFIFTVPFTYWKMVIVQPNSQMVSVANDLTSQLLRFLLISFLPILLLTAFLFRLYFTRPLRNIAKTVGQMGDLIEKSKYQQLESFSFPDSNVTEIKVISRRTRELVDKVVENEGALAQINVLLEKKVEKRTKDLVSVINKLKSSQVQLVQAEKMSTLGQMVAGVAHEVNTPLGYVRSNLQLVAENIGRFDELIDQTWHLLKLLRSPQHSQPELEDAIKTTLQTCTKIKEDELSKDLSGLIEDGLYGVNQIAELVVSLRDFSRIDETKIKNVNVNDCINSALTIARSQLRELTIKKELGDLPTIACNPSQINQVLLNLFINASQAIPDGMEGVLTIVSEVVTTEWPLTNADNDNTSTPTTLQDVVVIKVTDNGTGMDEETVKQVFEPFFTTKKAGDGTGLGLAISSQIIEKHGGSLQVQSVPGKGTRFIISLPIVQNQSTKGPDKPKALFIE